MSARFVRRALFALALAGCAPADVRQDAIVGALTRDDALLARARPALLAGKYARMARDVIAYFRGSIAVYRADVLDPRTLVGVTRFVAEGPLPLGLGDAHPENFGLLLGADGSLALEPNDFDAADRYPYTWDLRRLTTGLVLAAHASNPGDPGARMRAVGASDAIVAAAARSYADAIAAYASGAPRRPTTTAEGDPVLDDLFRRGARDAVARAELDALTEVEAGARRLRRGVLDPAEPEAALHDLPPFAVEALDGALVAYRASLAVDPGRDALTVLDAVRVFGSGVASWPRIRVLVLVRGPTDALDDDELLELKELGESGAGGWFPPGRAFDGPAAPVLGASRAVWARPDAEPWWGTVPSWLGVPVQIRREREGQKTIRVTRLIEARGTPEALISLGARLGAALARVHAAGEGRSAAIAIDTAIVRDSEGFVDDEVTVARVYAATVLEDFERFRAALRARGPLLGAWVVDGDAPSSDLGALLGTPEPVEAWE